MPNVFKLLKKQAVLSARSETHIFGERLNPKRRIIFQAITYEIKVHFYVFKLFTDLQKVFFNALVVCRILNIFKEKYIYFAAFKNFHPKR